MCSPIFFVFAETNPRANGAPRVPGRAVFTVELYLRTERVLVVGAETQETQRDWIQALTKVTHLCAQHTQTSCSKTKED